MEVRRAVRRSCKFDEDVEGDVWLRIVRKVQDGTIPPDATPGYFARMGRRVYLDMIRRESGRRETRARHLFEQSYESSTERDVDIRRFLERSVETELETLTVDQIAVQVAGGLSLEHRMIWLLAWEGHKQTVIAGILGRSKAFVSKSLTAIRRDLKQRFENPSPHEP